MERLDKIKKGIKALLGFPFYVYKSYQLLESEFKNLESEFKNLENQITAIQNSLHLERIKNLEKVLLYAGNIPEDSSAYENFIGLSLSKR